MLGRNGARPVRGAIPITKKGPSLFWERSNVVEEVNGKEEKVWGA